MGLGACSACSADLLHQEAVGVRTTVSGGQRVLLLCLVLLRKSEPGIKSVVFMAV